MEFANLWKKAWSTENLVFEDFCIEIELPNFDENSGFGCIDRPQFPSSPPRGRLWRALWARTGSRLPSHRGPCWAPLGENRGSRLPLTFGSGPVGPICLSSCSGDALRAYPSRVAHDVCRPHQDSKMGPKGPIRSQDTRWASSMPTNTRTWALWAPCVCEQGS